jgi:hypothetical protein
MENGRDRLKMEEIGSNGGDRLKREVWRVCKPEQIGITLMRSRIRIRTKVKSWIRIHMDQDPHYSDRFLKPDSEETLPKHPIRL